MNEYTLATLDAFINRVRHKSHGNEYVLEPKFERLYVRYGGRLIRYTTGQVERYEDVLDIANVTVELEHQRTGVFTALVARLRETYPGMHIFVEIASAEFEPLLLRLGFVPVLWDASFFLKAV